MGTVLPNFPASPISEVQPFTYRDNESYLSQLHRLRKYVRENLQRLNNQEIIDIAALRDQLNTLSDTLAGDITVFESTINDEIAGYVTQLNAAVATANAAKTEADAAVASQDSATAQNVNSGPLTSTALTTFGSTRWLNKSRAPLMLLDYCTGDGVTDDTASLQNALSDAASQNRALYSSPGVTYAINPVTISNAVRFEGQFNFVPVGMQATVLTVSAPVDFRAATVTINGQGKASNGLVISNGARSDLGDMTVTHCLCWGIYFAPVGNNNNVSAQRISAQSNGVLYTTNVTQTAATANVNTSLSGYSTLTLSTPLATNHATIDNVKFVIYNGRVFKVNTVLSPTQITVFNLDLTGMVNPIITIPAGGGMGIPKWTDSGVCSWQTLDITSNPGVGLLCVSLYGHLFDNPVIQGNTIGVGVYDYTLSMTMVKPYFELNTVDIAVWAYITGSIIDPTLTINPNTVQFIQGKISGATKIPNLIISQGGQTPGGLNADISPSSNPSPQTITLGQTYSFYRSGASWSFTINSNNRTMFGQYATVLVLNHASNFTAYPITIAPSVVGETIEGSATYTNSVTGRCVVILSLVGTDWKVSIIRDMTSGNNINYAPAFIGQMAVVGTVAYIATGTSASTDWKQITN